VIRVLLADDQGLVRAGFRALLSAQADIAVVGEAADGAEAVSLATDERPDIVLMDIRMPRMDGLEATRAITASLPDARVIVLTTFELDEYVFGALRAGASGFLLKDIDPPDLLAAVRVVADGEALLAPRLTRRLIEAFVAQERAAARRHSGGAHATRARGAHARRPRALQRGDRRGTGPVSADRQDPCGAAVRQTRCTRSRPARRDGVRDRAGRARAVIMNVVQLTRRRP
jgi:DNA-binding NarL/FixJ family response regulator